MATCPECDAEMDVDEFDVDRGDVVSCPECGSNLTVTRATPVELELATDDGEESGAAERGDEDGDDSDDDD